MSGSYAGGVRPRSALSLLLLASVVMATGILVSPRMAHAQSPPPVISCPADWSLHWTTVFGVQFPACPSAPFNIIVWYCVPDPAGPVFPKEQIVIKGLTMANGGTFPCPPTGQYILNLGEFIMFTLNPEGWTAPPCSEWCKQHPECFCPANYPQWIFGNGSCGKMVMVGDTASIVMCGEVDGEYTQNCYYFYHVCQDGGQLTRTLVGKITPDNCPGTQMSSECTIPLCDPNAEVTSPPPDTCEAPESEFPSGKSDLSTAENPNNQQKPSMLPHGRPSDKAVRREE